MILVREPVSKARILPLGPTKKARLPSLGLDFPESEEVRREVEVGVPVMKEFFQPLSSHFGKVASL
jgi:hypothetical protein